MTRRTLRPPRRRGRGAATFAAVLLALQAGCGSSGATCPGPASLAEALSSVGARDWARLEEVDVVPRWPVKLALEDGGAAIRSDGTAEPYRLWVRKDATDRRGCTCCQSLEFGAPPGAAPSLEAVSIYVPAPSWAEASREAARLLLSGIPPHVSVRLEIPPQPPPNLPWEVSSRWASEPDPDGRVLSGTAFLQVDRGSEGWVVLVRHGRSRPGAGVTVK